MKITAATISSKIQTKNTDFKVNVPIKVYLYFSFKVQKIPCQISSNEAMRTKRGLPVPTDVCTQGRGEFFSFFCVLSSYGRNKRNYPNLSRLSFGFTVTLNKRSLISILEIPSFSLITECQMFIFVALKNLNYERALGFFLI